LKLLLFNPENDLALANNDENYIAPASVRQMGEELSFLPIFWAKRGDVVLVPNREVAMEGLEHCVHGLYGAKYNKVFRTDVFLRDIDVRLVTPDELRSNSLTAVEPWGWNKALIKRLKMYGIDEALLPDVESMKKNRNLSNRSTACDVLIRIRETLADAVELEGFPLKQTVCGDSYKCFSLDDIRYCSYGYDAMLIKSSWSGSGRGLRFFNPKKDYNDEELRLREPLYGWCKNNIKRDGALYVEPFYDKVVDFAMEFNFENGICTYEGLSLFNTNLQGAYKSSVIADEKYKLAQITQYVSPMLLDCIKYNFIYNIGCQLYKDYRLYNGSMGVDMMICRDKKSDSKFLVHPCVEINVRMTMGLVSLAIRDCLNLGNDIYSYAVSYDQGHYKASILKVS
jgi:hypothetical protein